MLSSGGCLWNQNASLVCSSETHHCDQKKEKGKKKKTDRKKENHFQFRGENVHSPGVPALLRETPLEDVNTQGLGFTHGTDLSALRHPWAVPLISSECRAPPLSPRGRRLTTGRCWEAWTGEKDKEAGPWMQGWPRCSLGITCDPEDQSCVLRDSHPSPTLSIVFSWGCSEL